MPAEKNEENDNEELLKSAQKEDEKETVNDSESKEYGTSFEITVQSSSQGSVPRKTENAAGIMKNADYNPNDYIASQDYTSPDFNDYKFESE